MSIGDFVNKHISGTRGSGYVSDKDARKLDQQGENIQNDINNIKDTVAELSKPVNVTVEGSYNNLSTKDKIVLGTSVGAVAGGAFGVLKGTLQNMGDGATNLQNIDWVHHDIEMPKVDYTHQMQNIPGTTQVATVDGLQKVQVDNASVRHHFEPKITTEKIGEYKTPPENLKAQMEGGHMAAIEGLKFAVIGAGVGAAGTAAYVGLKKLKDKGDAPQTEEHKPVDIKFGDEKKTLIKSTLVGAGLGAAFGAIDGALEQGRAGKEITIEWKEPVMEHNVTIGKVPQDATVMVRDDVQYSQDAFKDSKFYNKPSDFNLDKHIKKAESVEIKGDKPDKGLLGVKMEDKSQTFQAEARYGMVGSIFAGTVLGGALGFVSGVALNTLKKMVNA